MANPSHLVLISIALLSCVQVGLAQCDAVAVLNEMKAELNSLRELYGNLSNVVENLEKKACNLEETIGHMNETVEDHKSQTTPKLISDAVLLKLLPYLNDLEDDLCEKIDATTDSLAADISGLNSSLSSYVTADVTDSNTAGDLQDGLLDLRESFTSLSEKICDLGENQSEYFIKDRAAVRVIDSKLDSVSAALSQEHTETINGQNTEENILTNVTKQLNDLDDFLQRHYSNDCGDTRYWRRIAHLDMTNPHINCPTGWKLIEEPKRTCGRNDTNRYTCNSVTFPVIGGSYSKVRGTIRAYQNNWPVAFDVGYTASIDDAYVTGISVTHGTPRQHIWTFAAGLSEILITRTDVCPCDATSETYVPSFVGKDYFCESGVNSYGFTGFHGDDPLWDGRGCTSSSTCCSFNCPPYFVKQLPSPTTDDIEIRLCHRYPDDDTPIEFIGLYVQ